MKAAIFLLAFYLLLGKATPAAHAAACVHPVPKVPVRVLDERQTYKLAALGSIQQLFSCDFTCDDDFVTNGDNDNDDAEHISGRRFRFFLKSRTPYIHLWLIKTTLVPSSRSSFTAYAFPDKCILQSIFRV